MAKIDGVQEVAISELRPYSKNAKKHGAEQVDLIAKSIKEFGFLNPILIDADKNIIAGHGRLMAAKQLNMESVPCIYVEGLSEEQYKAYVLADNKLTELGEWDMDLVFEELDYLKEMNFDISLTGFDVEIKTEEEKEVEEDDYEEPENIEPRAKLGDIYQLGRHRLMCGDSTSPTDVEKLVGGVDIDMVFTDPPYNIDYKGVNDNRKIKNDKMSDDNFVDFLTQSIRPSETCYVCCSWQYAHLFRKAMEKLGMPPKAMIIWNKVNPAQHLDKYFKQHEIIWYYGKFGGEKTLRGDIWECKRQKNTIHPTMKPIELITMALTDNPGKTNVYDGFGGSGSTLIACEQTDKNCYMMEYEPHYVDVIIDRWEKFTGEKAKLLSSEE